jgi:hypothetical protein
VGIYPQSLSLTPPSLSSQALEHIRSTHILQPFHHHYHIHPSDKHKHSKQKAMSFFGGRRDDDVEEERITETYTSTDYDRGYGGGGYGYGGGYGGPRREEERVTETTYYESDRPPPPEVPYPWRPHWDERERRYIFVNEQSGERTWEFPRSGGYGGGYGERRTTYETEEVVDERGERRGGGGHGLMYGAMGAAAGLAGGAFLAHEAGKVEGRFEEDKYRVENGVEDFPENAAECKLFLPFFPPMQPPNLLLKQGPAAKSAKSKTYRKTSSKASTASATASSPASTMLWMMWRTSRRMRRSGRAGRWEMLRGLGIILGMLTMRANTRVGMMGGRSDLALRAAGGGGWGSDDVTAGILHL